MAYSTRPSRQRPTRRSSSLSRSHGRGVGGGHGTDYMLHRHAINFNGRSRAQEFLSRYDPRMVAVLAAAAVLLLVLVFGIVGCARGCSSTKAADAAATTANEQDARVAAGVSSEMTSRLTAALDRDDEIAWIAANADQYASERVVGLALDEPAAVDFVYSLPSADKAAKSYDDAVTQGTVPLLYDWDVRWGYVDYAGLPLGVTGSGPTCLSMAYMGLSGKGDKTPADLATLATGDGLATGDEGTSGELFTREASGLGLACEQYDSSESGLAGALRNGHVVICQVKAGTITAEAHWALAVALDGDGAVTLYDPTSTVASTHAWDAATVAADSSALYSLSLMSSE